MNKVVEELQRAIRYYDDRINWVDRSLFVAEKFDFSSEIAWLTREKNLLIEAKDRLMGILKSLESSMEAKKWDQLKI